jgi:hypothetical protein
MDSRLRQVLAGVSWRPGAGAGHGQGGPGVWGRIETWLAAHVPACHVGIGGNVGAWGHGQCVPIADALNGTGSLAEEYRPVVEGGLLGWRQ